MAFRLSLLAAAVLLSLQGHATATQPQPVPLTLAKAFHQDTDVTDYWWSEKLDGIRAVWNGQQLMTRSGKPIITPEWFVQPLPDYPLEGELWAGRGKYSIVHRPCWIRRHPT